MQNLNRIRISIIGFGYWGPNYCRVIKSNQHVELGIICDHDPERLKVAKQFYPDTECTDDINVILKDERTHAVIVATQVSTHASIIKMILKSGKHVLCEKPLVQHTYEISEIYDILLQSGKILMCAHIFEFNPVIRYIRQYLNENCIGDYLYISANRNGLGPVRKDVNVIYDLASHDISIILYLFGKMPLYVSAVGKSYLNNDIEDISFIYLEFENNFFVSIQVSWLDPIKERILRIVGSKKMLVFNDISVDEKLKIFNTGNSYLSFKGDFGSFQSMIKDGDIFIPNIKYEEPLVIQFEHFVYCITNNLVPDTDIIKAGKVVKILEALNQSIKNNGHRTEICQ